MGDLQTLQDELEQLKKQCEQAAKQKTVKKLERQVAIEKFDELENELDELNVTKKKLQDALKEQQERFQEEMLDLTATYDELIEEESELQKNFSTSEKNCRSIQDNLMVYGQLPQKNVNFKETLNTANAPMDITYTCYMTSGRPFILGAGQALLTFEKEKVANSVLTKKRHCVEISDARVNVEAQQPQLDKSVKFEVRMDISCKKLKVSNLPEDIAEETLKDKVELTFYKSSIGGAEIEEVEYDRNHNTAYVTYLQNGVAQRVLKSRWHQFVAGEVTCEVEVMPCVNIELNKLQMFSADSPRSVLLTGIKNVDGEEDDVKDFIEIHFQKESIGGGEVESISFSQDKKKTLIFEEDLK
ncbi:N-myc-interactor [Rana temporaria]|uniref:N-myc-interactor n=1 Tax=Rana temporaria TaxID=8407 RepID=UPI001AACA0DE|nr:N-myc-interactor [Rana temporaria]XP_040213946.1 N-myc-interactor [Rana temporaria]